MLSITRHHFMNIVIFIEISLLFCILCFSSNYPSSIVLCYSGPSLNCSNPIQCVARAETTLGFLQLIPYGDPLYTETCHLSLYNSDGITLANTDSAWGYNPRMSISASSGYAITYQTFGGLTIDTWYVLKGGCNDQFGTGAQLFINTSTTRLRFNPVQPKLLLFANPNIYYNVTLPYQNGPYVDPLIPNINYTINYLNLGVSLSNHGPPSPNVASNSVFNPRFFYGTNDVPIFVQVYHYSPPYYVSLDLQVISPTSSPTDSGVLGPFLFQPTSPPPPTNISIIILSSNSLNISFVTSAPNNNGIGTDPTLILLQCTIYLDGRPNDQTPIQPITFFYPNYSIPLYGIFNNLPINPSLYTALVTCSNGISQSPATYSYSSPSYSSSYFDPPSFYDNHISPQPIQSTTNQINNFFFYPPASIVSFTCIIYGYNISFLSQNSNLLSNDNPPPSPSFMKTFSPTGGGNGAKTITEIIPILIYSGNYTFYAQCINQNGLKSILVPGPTLSTLPPTLAYSSSLIFYNPPKSYGFQAKISFGLRVGSPVTSCTLLLTYANNGSYISFCNTNWYSLSGPIIFNTPPYVELNLFKFRCLPTSTTITASLSCMNSVGTYTTLQNFTTTYPYWNTTGITMSFFIPFPGYFNFTGFLLPLITPSSSFPLGVTLPGYCDILFFPPGISPSNYSVGGSSFLTYTIPRYGGFSFSNWNIPITFLSSVPQTGTSYDIYFECNLNGDFSPLFGPFTIYTLNPPPPPSSSSSSSISSSSKSSSSSSSSSSSASSLSVSLSLSNSPSVLYSSLSSSSSSSLSSSSSSSSSTNSSNSTSSTPQASDSPTGFNSLTSLQQILVYAGGGVVGFIILIIILRCIYLRRKDKSMSTTSSSISRYGQDYGEDSDYLFSPTSGPLKKNPASSMQAFSLNSA